jgi:hypothetical protein
MGGGRNGSFDGEERTDARLHGTWLARVARAGHDRGRGWLGVCRSAGTWARAGALIFGVGLGSLTAAQSGRAPGRGRGRASRTPGRGRGELLARGTHSVAGSARRAARRVGQGRVLVRGGAPAARVTWPGAGAGSSECAQGGSAGWPTCRCRGAGRCSVQG